MNQILFANGLFIQPDMSWGGSRLQSIYFTAETMGVKDKKMLKGHTSTL